MEYININGKEYQFVIGYGKSNELRKSLNDLTQKIFGFNFEQERRALPCQLLSFYCSYQTYSAF